MTKKHFKAIAEMFNRERPADCYSRDFVLWKNIVDRLCIEFSHINPRFESERFIAACSGLPYRK